MPFRIGTTSYIYRDDILPNVRLLAPQVDDVELVLFEVEEANNLPTMKEIAELRQLAATHDLTYTVHLPLDLQLATANETERRASVAKARRVIEATRPLEPWGYVIHVNVAAYRRSSNPIPGGARPPDGWEAWQARARCSLETLAETTGEVDLLCLENVESYPPQHLLPLADELEASLCLDVGHLLMQGLDPLAYLDDYLGRGTRVIHLHGLTHGRDHRSLIHMDTNLLRAVLARLRAQAFVHVVTVEVFSERDLVSSKELLKTMWPSIKV
ncbi:MAG: cobamide remodeling phosphodiesterase CbiR [Anaerolineae bacterium]